MVPVDAYTRCADSSEQHTTESLFLVHKKSANSLTTTYHPILRKDKLMQNGHGGWE